MEKEEINNSNNLESDTPKKNKTKIIIFIALAIILIILASIFLIYFLKKVPEVKFGDNIEAVSLSETGEEALIKLDKDLNLSEIAKVKFLFRDNENEYQYETEEISYTYKINAGSAGLENFKDIKEVYVIFTFINGTISELPPGTTSTGTGTNASTNRTSGGSGGGGGGGGGNGNGGCTPNCAGKNCGDNGCGGSCGSCNENQTCESGVCVEETQITDSHFGMGGGLPMFAAELEEAGIEITRQWIEWRRIEPEDDVYNWTEMDEIVKNANERDMEVLGYFAFMPTWAMNMSNPKCQIILKTGPPSPCEPLDWNDYKEFARNVSERYDGTKYVCGELSNEYCGEMKYIEIWNEVQGFAIMNSTEYEPWLINGYQAVKQGNPNAQVLVGAVHSPLGGNVNGSGQDTIDFVDAMIRDYDQYYDIFNFHAYEFEDSFVGETINYIKGRMDNYGVDKPMWLTETATFIGIIKCNNLSWYDNMAKGVIKRYAQALGNDVEKVFWYVFMSLPTEEEDSTGVKCGTATDSLGGLGWVYPKGLGLPIDEFHPRPTYYTYKNMTSKLSGFTSVTKLTDSQYKFTFTDKDPVYVLWCDSGSCSIDLEITGNVKVTDYLGNEETKDASTITLTESPVFVEETTEIPGTAYKLVNVINETNITPGDGAYKRSELLVINNELYFAFEKGSTFKLVELYENLSYKSPVYNIFAGPESLIPHDIRLATDGTKLWYAFETVNNTARDTCEGHFLNIAKYDISGVLILENNKTYIASGCGTSREDYLNPTGTFPQYPEAVDDPTPIYYNNEYVVLTRAWNGSVQHIRTFDADFNLIRNFTLDLGSLSEMNGRILSQFSLVNIDGDVYLIGGLVNYTNPNSEAGIYAIKLSSDLSSAVEITPLVNYPGRAFKKVNRAIYNDNKLYVTYAESIAGNQYHNLGVYDVNNNFKKIEEIQFQDVSVEINHASMEVFNDKVYVVYQEDEIPPMDILGQVFEWSGEETTLDSPFGVRELVYPLDEQDEVKDLGIKWIEYGGLHGITWERYQDLGDAFWEKPDTLYSEAEANGSYISFVIVGSVPNSSVPKYDIPEDMDAYKEFIKNATKRYPNVKVWEIQQELENQWVENLSAYALFLKESYKAIKEVNPNAEIAYAGLASWAEITGTLPVVLSELNNISDFPGDKYFDSISLKWSQNSNYKQRYTGPTGNHSLEEHINKIKEKLEEVGYTNIPIWISATSYYDGVPTDKYGVPLLLRTEKEQAIELLKRYVYPISLGLTIMFWITILEYSGSFGLPAGSYFDNVGLINNPKTDGKDWKKLSYYTYKQMTEKLEGSDWDNIKNIAEGPDVYAYKFMNNGKPIWVAWSDSGSGQVIINGISSDYVKITDAVPYFDDGLILNTSGVNYPNFFNTETKTVSGGEVTITLEESPIFVEEITEIPGTAYKLVNAINKTSITPGDGAYKRSELLVINNELYFAFEKGSTFKLVELYENLSYKSPVYNIFAGPESLIPHDIRLATDGTKLWYAFETVNNTARDTCEGHFLNIAKYDISGVLILENNKTYIASGCGTSREDYLNPTGTFPQYPEAVDDPTPIYYNNEYVVLTRAWNGTIQHIRTFDTNFNLIRNFTLDLGSLSEMNGRVLSQNAFVNINGNIYLIGGLINYTNPNSEAAIYAIKLSNDLSSVVGITPLVSSPGRSFKKATKAVYNDNKLYIIYGESISRDQYHHVGVYNTSNNFAKIQEIQFQDVSVDINHASMEVFNDKIYVVYQEDEIPPMDILGQVFEWSVEEDGEINSQSTPLNGFKIFLGIIILGLIVILIIFFVNKNKKN